MEIDLKLNLPYRTLFCGWGCILNTGEKHLRVYM